MRKSTLSFAIAVALLCGAARAAAEPIVKPSRFESAARCTTAAGSTVDLDAGTVVVPPDKWAELDSEMRRLQTLETRLTAENKSLKKSLRAKPPVIVSLAGALVGGFLAGIAYDAF